MSDPLLGSIINERYLLTHVVGQGGMGIVYRAEDVRLNGRPCAIKLLTGQSADPEEANRFERELHIISRLRSQHVVQVLDTGSLPDGRRHIVMELLEGLPLSQLLKAGGALSTSRAINVIKGVLAGLSEAHEHGVVHRDLKPANVFITRARTGAEVAKVLDFGIAKDTRQKRQEDLTAASMLIGTPKYMAPEQFLKQPADGRTDLYAAGLLLYQMLTGKPPFLANMPVPDTIATMPPEFRIGWMHINQPPTPLQLPPGLWAIIERLLAKQPDARFENADQVIEALVAIEHSGRVPDPLPQIEGSGVRLVQVETPSNTTGFPVVGEQLEPPAEVAAPKSRKGLLVGASVVVAALAGAGVWWAMRAQPAADGPAAAAKTGLCVNEIRSEPDGAAIRQGPNNLGFTPYEVERPCHEVWMIEVERKGYKTEKLTLRSRDARESVFLQLEAETRPAPAPAPAEAPPSAAPASEAAKPKAAPSKARKPARRAAPKAAPKATRPAPAKGRAAPARKPAPPKKAPVDKAPASKAPASKPPPAKADDDSLFF